MLIICISLPPTVFADEGEDLENLRPFECKAVLYGHIKLPPELKAEHFIVTDGEFPGGTGVELEETSLALAKKVFAVPKAHVLVFHGPKVAALLESTEEQIPTAWAHQTVDSQTTASRRGLDADFSRSAFRRILWGIGVPMATAFAGYFIMHSAAQLKDPVQMASLWSGGLALLVGGLLYTWFDHFVIFGRSDRNYRGNNRAQRQQEASRRARLPQIASRYAGRNIASLLQEQLNLRTDDFELSMPLDTAADGLDANPEAALILGRKDGEEYLVLALRPEASN